MGGDEEVEAEERRSRVLKKNRGKKETKGEVVI